MVVHSTCKFALTCSINRSATTLLNRLLSVGHPLQQILQLGGRQTVQLREQSLSAHAGSPRTALQNRSSSLQPHGFRLLDFDRQTRNRRSFKKCENREFDAECFFNLNKQMHRKGRIAAQVEIILIAPNRFHAE